MLPGQEPSAAVTPVGRGRSGGVEMQFSKRRMNVAMMAVMAAVLIPVLSLAAPTAAAAATPAHPAVPTPATGLTSRATAPVSIAFVHSYPPIFPGGQGSYTLPYVTYKGSTYPNDHDVTFDVADSSSPTTLGTHEFSITFDGPNGTSVVPGVYNNAQHWPSNGSSPGFDIGGGGPSGGGTDCNTYTGSYQVDDATYAGSTLVSFAASMTLECDSGTAQIIARIIWNSSAGSTSPDLCGTCQAH